MHLPPFVAIVFKFFSIYIKFLNLKFDSHFVKKNQINAKTLLISGSQLYFLFLHFLIIAFLCISDIRGNVFSWNSKNN